MSRRSRRQVAEATAVDRSVAVGSLTLSSPLMTASGTAGYGSELAPYLDLSQIGAVVTKSIAPYEWAGNPAPRVHTVQAGMINAVGLQGPGVEYWLAHELPKLISTGASVVCSIWGRSVEDYALASQMLASAPAEVIAVEVNLSCPNLEGRGSIFAHDADLSSAVMQVTAACERPRWAKLSPNTDRLVEIADAVSNSGAEAVTLVNTLLGLVFDPETARPVLGNGGGGVSGPAIHPIAVRAVADVRSAFPALPIVGVGGVINGWGAAELMLAGAHAVQVGTATFANPAAIETIQRELLAYAASRSLSSVSELTSAGFAER